MKKKIISLLLIFFVLINFYFIFKSFYDNKITYFILDYNNVWKYDGKKVEKINKRILKKFSFSNITKYGLSNETGYFDFDEKSFYNEAYEKSGFNTKDIAVKGPSNVQNYSYEITTNLTSDDKRIISGVLSDNDKKAEFDKLYINKAILNKGTLYFIMPYNDTGLEGYSLVFLVNNGQVQKIYNKNLFGSKTGRLSSLNKIVDLDNDGLEEIILISEINGSAGNECYNLYKYNTDLKKYENIIDCEE